MTSSGHTRKVSESHFLEIPSRAGSLRADSSSCLCLCTGNCPQKVTALPCLEGELRDDEFSSPAHHRYCNSWAGTRKHGIDA